MVRNVDEAAADGSGYDYVFVCIKALPDIYKLGEVIKPVITPSHTCIIVNTTTALDVEAELMEMYPRNMVLSLCSGVELTQTGPADFDHTETRSVHIGALRENPALPREAQQDMTESLTLTLEAGALECTPTVNIEKHQWERLIGAIAFHPISVILKEPNHVKLMEDIHTKQLIEEIFDECLRICESRRITFPFDFKSRTLGALTNTRESKSTMYQDFLAGRPLEIEVYLVTPIRFASTAGVEVPRLRSIHALLQHINKVNQQNSSSPVHAQPAGRLQQQHTGQSTMGSARPYVQRGMTDGSIMNGGRAMSMVYGPPPTNGYPRAPPQQARRGPSQVTRQSSLEGLEEFASVAMYNELVPTNGGNAYDNRQSARGDPEYNYAGDRPVGRPMPPRASTSQGYYPHAAKSDNQPRQGAFAMMGRKMSNMRLSSRGGTAARDFDDDDDDDYVDAAPASRGPAVNPDQVDMLAMTRRGRNSAMGNRLESDRNSSFVAGRPNGRSGKPSSQALMNDIPNVHDAVTNTALFGMGDNRYGTVDSRSLAKSANEARLNSMQSSRLPSMSVVNGQPQPYSNQNHRQQGPPNAMNGRGPYSSDMPHRGGPPHGAAASFRGQIPPQAVQRQHILAQGGSFSAKGSDPNMPAGTRSVTGSASASFGSLGNGSGSHSSSSSRDEIPPPPRAAH